MRTTCKVFNIIAIIFGLLAIFGMVSEETVEGAMYCALGGIMFAGLGTMNLVYISQQPNKTTKE